MIFGKLLYGATTAGVSTSKAVTHPGAGVVHTSSSFWVITAVWVGLMYFLFFHSPKKREKKRKEMLDAILVGDEVVTIGGIKGKITSAEGDFFKLKIDKGVNLEIKRSSIANKYEENNN